MTAGWTLFCVSKKWVEKRLGRDASPYQRAVRCGQRALAYLSQPKEVRTRDRSSVLA